MFISTQPRAMTKFIKNYYPIKEDLVGIEIGVEAGFNALTIFKTLNMKKLYLIDSYPKEEYQRAKHIMVISIDEQIQLGNIKHEQVGFLEMHGLEAAKRFENESIDFVYIDAGDSIMGDYYSYPTFFYAYLPKVKVGGIIGGHDYTLNTHNVELKRAIEKLNGKLNGNLLFGLDYERVLQQPNAPLCHDWWFVKSEEAMGDTENLMMDIKSMLNPNILKDYNIE
jgi:predicted O-methyltransferase YrrM